MFALDLQYLSGIEQHSFVDWWQLWFWRWGKTLFRLRRLIGSRSADGSAEYVSSFMRVLKSKCRIYVETGAIYSPLFRCIFFY
jgi:hypothetical protein